MAPLLLDRRTAICGGLASAAPLMIPHITMGAPRNADYLLCSTTQTADFARQVVGDRLGVQCVLAPGEDPHLYRLKPRDATLAAGALLCVRNGWHLEGKHWMETLAKNARKELVTCVEGLKPAVLEEEGEQVNDPHAWFTPRNAATYVRNIVRSLVKRRPQWQTQFEARARLYLSQLRELDRWIRTQVDRLPRERRVLVTSHDAFNYFCLEYGFEARSPAGWSTGEEVGGGATPGRRRQVVASIREAGVPAIFVETSVNPELIQEIAKDAGVVIGGKLYSDSMGVRGSAGESYLGMMRENVLTMVDALAPKPAKAVEPPGGSQRDKPLRTEGKTTSRIADWGELVFPGLLNRRGAPRFASRSRHHGEN